MDIIVEPLFNLVQRLPWLALVWIAMIGAAIGSFMNVVVYRLPRQMSLSKPGSQCPRCHHPIRWYDNIPVISWLCLRARCRNCHAPISARYPFIEATMMIVFTVQAVADFANGVGSIDRFALLMLSLLRKLTTISVLVCATLIVWDRQRVPATLFGFAATVLTLCMLTQCMLTQCMLTQSLFSEVASPFSISALPYSGPQQLVSHVVGMLSAVIGSLILRRVLMTPEIEPSWSVHAMAALVGWSLTPLFGLFIVFVAYAWSGALRRCRRDELSTRLWATLLTLVCWVGMLV